ncbi:hypothetical protein LTR53_000997 [Teratosphaeriaceae sp. CCFEE 6253]|nr:hypothetical protein LTR53_000997 [Teratosphaeriaceae sp. CCFEE 6253]
MDPASIIGLVGSCVTIIARAGVVAGDIHDLSLRYKNVAKNVNLITVQLSTFKAAIVLLSSCLERRVTTLVHRADLVVELGASLAACSSIISAVQEQVAGVSAKSGSTSVLDFMTRIKHMWDEKSVNDCVRMLEVQVQALSFLIQVLQLNSADAQRSLLSSSERRSVLDRARDDASSVSPRFESSTMRSQRTADGDSIVGPFAFDEQILNTAAYRSAFFSLMRRELSNEPPAIEARVEDTLPARDPFADPRTARQRISNDQLLSSLGALNVSDDITVARPAPSELRIGQEPPLDDGFTAPVARARTNGTVGDSFTRVDDSDDISVATSPTIDSRSSVARSLSTFSSTNTDQAVNLYDAAERGDVKAIKWMLSEGANVEAGRNGWPPIQIAAHRGHLDAVKLLLEHEADSKTLTTVAFANKDVPLLANLLSSPRLTEVYAQFHSACQEGKADVADLVLRAGGKANYTDASGRTPLHLAASAGHEEVVDVLLAGKASVNWSDIEGWQPLACACHKGALLVSEKLLLTGANRLDAGANIEALGGELGTAPLAIAARSGKADLVELLMRRGADVNARDTQNGTAISTAWQNRHVNIIKLLRAGGADHELDKRIDHLGETTLHEFCRAPGDSTTRIEQLLQLGVDLTPTDNRGNTALSIATAMLRERTVRLLLANGAVVDEATYANIRAARTQHMVGKLVGSRRETTRPGRRSLTCSPRGMRKVMKKSVISPPPLLIVTTNSRTWCSRKWLSQP